jgi:hypothetical protein
MTKLIGMALCAALALCMGGPPSHDLMSGHLEEISERQVPGLEAVLAKDKAIRRHQVSGPRTLAVPGALAVEDVRAGKVRITGIVSRQVLKDRAESIAKDMEGVVDVVSTITVDETLKDKRLSLDDM